MFLIDSTYTATLVKHQTNSYQLLRRVVVNLPPKRLPVLTWLGIWLRLYSFFTCSVSSENLITLKFILSSDFTAFDWTATCRRVFTDPEDMVLNIWRLTGPLLSSSVRSSLLEIISMFLGRVRPPMKNSNTFFW